MMNSLILTKYTNNVFLSLTEICEAHCKHSKQVQEKLLVRWKNVVRHVIWGTATAVMNKNTIMKGFW